MSKSMKYSQDARPKMYLLPVEAWLETAADKGPTANRVIRAMMGRDDSSLQSTKSLFALSCTEFDGESEA